MRLAIALVATLGLAGAAAAQPPAAAPHPMPSPHAMELAHQIYESLGGASQIQATAERLMAPMFRMMPSTPVNGKDMRADLTVFIKAELTKYMPQMQGVTERAYAETFTEAQLQELLAFYRSPIGRAYVAKLPEIGSRTAALMTPVYAQIRFDTLNHVCDINSCTPEQRAQVMKLANG